MSSLREEVLKILDKEARFVTKRELCDTLKLKGKRKIELKILLSQLKQEGLYGRSKDYVHTLKAVPRVAKNASPSAHYEIDHATLIKKHLGVVRFTGTACTIESAHRKDQFPALHCKLSLIEKYAKQLNAEISNNDVVLFSKVQNCDLVIHSVIGSLDSPRIFSMMAIGNADVPFEFSDKAIEQAKNATLPSIKKRFDFRDTPLVTIDGEDARDFDDAVWATPDTDPKNQGGWRAIVAIADVSYYVRPGDCLDIEAYERGNSIYFPDRVVPMLPEGLSNEMCSLKPHVDRACLAVEMIISPTGGIKSHHFKRGIMRSAARLTYTQVQEAIEGNFTHITRDMWEDILKPLYGCYLSLRRAREQRGALEINSTEYKVNMEDTGKVISIDKRIQKESNQLIEEFMVAANVAAAKALYGKDWSFLYRVHDAPDTKKVDNLQTIMKSMRINMPRVKKITPHAFNQILAQKTPFHQMINDLVLRSQAQAQYSPANKGHFGLGLTHYAHFTSPIRRYADIQVHRSLIAAFNLGEGGQDLIPMEMLHQMGEHVSKTERTAAQMERDVMDRYMVQYLTDYVGKIFTAKIVGVNVAGIFFALDTNGAQGFIHKANLPGDYFVHDEANYRYIGRRTKRVYQLGDAIVVLLEGTDVQLSSTTFSIVEGKGDIKRTKDTLPDDIRASQHYNTPQAKKKFTKQKDSRADAGTEKQKRRSAADDFSAAKSDKPYHKKKPKH